MIGKPFVLLLAIALAAGSSSLLAQSLNSGLRFCTSCHVPQNVVKAPIANDFIDVDTLISRATPGGRR